MFLLPEQTDADLTQNAEADRVEKNITENIISAVVRER